MADANLSHAIGLAPANAIEYFKSKGYQITWDWREMAGQAHAKAFTVAGMTKLDVLQDIREALADALANGKTQAQFAKELKTILQSKGWWGKHAQTDPLTGEVFGKGLTPYRLRTIYQANMQSAYMAGRHAEMVENVDHRPLWEYVAVMDSRTRPEHRALDGRVFRHDDPFWDTFYPPNGFNCRCRVRARTAEQVRRSNVRVSNGYGRMESANIPTGRDGRPAKVKGYRDPVTGKLQLPDVGWDYNPGKQAQTKLNALAIDKLAAAPLVLQKHFVREQVGGKSFAQFFAKPQGQFLIGVLKPDHAKAIKAETSVAVLSSSTMEKQNKVHPELHQVEYLSVQTALDTGEMIQESERSLIYLLQEKDGGYVTIVKATKTGRGLFVTSFRRLSGDAAKRDKEIKRLRKKGK